MYACNLILLAALNFKLIRIPIHWSNLLLELIEIQPQTRGYFVYTPSMPKKPAKSPKGRNNADFHNSKAVDKTYTVGELAKALSVHRNTVRNWVNQGKFEQSHQTLGGAKGPGRHRVKLSQEQINSYLGYKD